MTLPAFIRSLLLASALSFATPILLVGILLVGLYAGGQIPVINGFSQAIADQILQFLTTFGNGNALEGALTIGLTCGLVGAIFDTYAFYRHRT